MAEMGVSRELKLKDTSRGDHIFQPGDEVLVWRERIINSRIEEWLGTFTVLDVSENKRQVYVQDTLVGAASSSRVVQVKRYHATDQIAQFFMLEPGMDMSRLETFFSRKRK